MGLNSETSWNGLFFSIATDTITVSLLLLVLLSFGYSYTVSNHGLSKDGKKYPKFAPGGMWHHIQMATSSEYPWWVLEVANQLQTRVFQLSLPNGPSTHNFVVGEPKTFRAILTDPLSTKPEIIYSHLKNVMGGATMFTTNGAEWHSKRKAVAPAFSSNQVKRMTRVAVEKTEAWINGTLMNNDNVVFDVSKEMIVIVLEAISETAFEYEITEHEKDNFLAELELALIEFAMKSPSNPLRNLFGWFIPERRRAFVAAKNVNGLMLKIMKEYRKKKEPSNTGTIIQMIMESDHAFPTDELKASQLGEFLLAGHDTTGYSISWILLNLAQNPEEQTKLRESLSHLSPENWSSCKQLQWAVKESMRLNPVASAGSVRLLGRDIITEQNEVLPKGSVCFLPFMLLFRNPDIFHDSGLFLPGRWENPSREMLDAFNPFALGKQNCVGQSLAKAETFAIVARIFSEYELSVESEGSVDFFLTLKPVGAYLRARKV